MIKNLKTNKANTKLVAMEITTVALFTVSLVICSWVVIPFGSIPFTMQTFALFLAIYTIGPRLSLYVLVSYLLLGIVGLPVFSGFNSGFGAVIGVTGGYLVGFFFPIICTLISQKIFSNKAWLTLLSSIVGLILCYALGTWWFINVYSSNNETIGVFSVLAITVFPFVIPDLFKIGLAYAISKTLRKNRV